MLGLDRTVDLPQLPQAHQQLRLGFDVQQHLDRVKPRAVLVDHHRAITVCIPAAQVAPHRGGQVAVAPFEGVIQLRKEEGVVAHHPPNAQQRIAQWRAHPFAGDFGVLGQQLAQ
jgi:hypothetical protein